MAEWQIVCDDVIHWAAEYQGKPFMAILCDPSYALSKKKKVDPDTPVEIEIKTVEDLVKAYHSFQQWGDTGFMNRDWDTAIAFNPETWAALAEHLLPGGFLFVFASSRGWHRLACALEDAGLIIQPSVFIWLNAQAFPKATRLRKAPKPKRQRLYRWLGWIGKLGNWLLRKRGEPPRYYLDFVWGGHRYGGQILKNCAEPIIVAQKPWEGKRLDCIVETGAGTLWVDGGRINCNLKTEDLARGRKCSEGISIWGNAGQTKHLEAHPQGRWPANFVLCHSEGCERVGVKRVKGSRIEKPCDYGGDAGMFGNKGDRPARGIGDPDGLETIDDFRCVEECPARKLGEQSGESKSIRSMRGDLVDNRGDNYGRAQGKRITNSNYMRGHNDKGTAARYFFQADWQHEKIEATMVDKSVFLLYNIEKSEVNQCCETASIAAMNSMLGNLMSNGALGDSVADLVVTLIGRKEAKLTLGSTSPKEMVGVIAAGEKKEAESSIGNLKADGFGNSPTRLSQRGLKSTTLTETKQTMSCPTCNLSLLLTMTIYTNENVKTIGLNLMGQRHEGVSDVDNTSPLTGLQSGLLEPIMDTVGIAALNTNENGAKGILLISGIICESGMQPKKQADWNHEVTERIAGADPVRYCPKSAKTERTKGLADFYWRVDKTAPMGYARIDKDEWEALGREEERIHEETGKRVRLRAQGNIHSTLKPISLCKHLTVLLSPPKEYAPRRILIPFCGTMSEGIGVLLSGGFEEVVGVEINKDFCDIGEARMKFWQAKMQETGLSDPKAILKTCNKKGKKNPRQDKLL